MAIVQLIRQRAESQPEHPAYVPYGFGPVLSYRALVTRADQIAAALLRAGCKPGQRCGLLQDEGPGFLTRALGILAARLCLMPINPLWREEETEFVIQKAGLHWLLGPESHLTRFPFAQPLDDQNDSEYASLSPAFIRFTSGTTGRRKGVLLSHETIIQRLAAADELLQISPRDCIWFQLPMVDHFVVSTLLYLSRGATIVTARSADPASFTQLVAEYRPTISYASPDFYEALVTAPIRDLDCLRLAISTTALLSSKTQTAFIQRFHRPVNAALGIIEVGLLTLNTHPEHPDSVGRPLPAYRVTLIGDDGRSAAPGEPGELCVNGPGLLNAYLNPWLLRAAILSPHGYHTGDYARQDSGGLIYLLGRSKNRITVDGAAVFYEQIEEVLNAAPGIRETRVSLENGKLIADVVGAPNSIACLPGLARRRLPPEAVPQVFHRVSELPRTANGKLLRR